eukprot:252182-Prymnesium_polylepis.2
MSERRAAENDQLVRVLLQNRPHDFGERAHVLHIRTERAAERVVVYQRHIVITEVHHGDVCALHAPREVCNVVPHLRGVALPDLVHHNPVAGSARDGLRATGFAIPGARTQEPEAAKAEQRPEAVHHGSRHAVAVEGYVPHPSRPHDLTERASIDPLDGETIATRWLPSEPLRAPDAQRRRSGGRGCGGRSARTSCSTFLEREVGAECLDHRVICARRHRLVRKGGQAAARDKGFGSQERRKLLLDPVALRLARPALRRLPESQCRLLKRRWDVGAHALARTTATFATTEAAGACLFTL